ncbi:hypothetical protein [Paraburkholderia atlantica]|uniref:hypothetical protein n=1 Tax=Paraburkholderia atlantica TaxID=2654982 RepID=UPI00160A41F7|nr:hypothetical protein [Paraburkholderia atlantica]MBB5414076.1 hypothetical protein [Paraburkholderia atlantica]
MNRPWSNEEIEIVRNAWLGEGNFKSCLRFLDNRTYAAAATYASKRLGLGPRVHNDRGVKPFAWDLVEAELIKSPGTSGELVKRTGLSESSVAEQIRESNAGPQGRIHIIDWRRRARGGTPHAIYAIGPGENVPMPKPIPYEEKVAANKRRRRANRTCAVSKAVNPFASAAGLVSAPTGQPGRVYHHLVDDDREAA